MKTLLSKLAIKFTKKTRHLYNPYYNIQRKSFKKFFDDNAINGNYIFHEINESSLVFDIGGYYGDWADKIYSIYEPNIYIFEPSETSKFLKTKYKLNKKIKIFDFALGSNTNKLKFYTNSKSPSISASSIKKNNLLDREVFFQSLDIVEFFETEKLNKVDLISMNIEGGEYELLNRIIDTGIIKKIKSLMIQFHFIKFSKNEIQVYRNLIKNLEKTHHQQWNYPYVWEKWEINK